MLEKIFIKDSENVQSSAVRTKYGYLASGISLCANIVLAVAKITVGFIFSSIAIIADGINNLLDGGSQTVSLVSFKLANKPADSEHPYGHARIEYVASLVISMIILFLGFQLIVSSIQNIVSPMATEYSLAMIVVLAISIVVKLYLGFFNKRLSKKIGSLTLIATSKDSFNDCFITTTVLVCLIIAKYTGVMLDAYLGIVVALFILFDGIMLVRETVKKLIGEGANKKLTDSILQKIKKYDGVMGVHDIEAHNYGPNRYFISLHVEVDRNVDIMKSHEMIDKIENDLSDDNIKVVIHMDPIVTNDPVLDSYKQFEKELIVTINDKCTLHDFRMVKGENRTNLIFDVRVPYTDKRKDSEIKQIIFNKTMDKFNKVYTIVNVDRF